MPQKRLLRTMTLVHLLNWFIVFSPAALVLYPVTWLLWLAVPVTMALATLSLSRAIGWNLVRSLLFAVAVLNAIAFTRVTIIPLFDGGGTWFVGSYFFLVSAMILPLLALAVSAPPRSKKPVDEMRSDAPNEPPAAIATPA